MRVFLSAAFERDYRDPPRDAQRKVDKALRLFGDDPRHPSPRFKKLETRDDIRSIRVTRAVRITLTVEGDAAVLRRVGPHDDAYRRP